MEDASSSWTHPIVIAAGVALATFCAAGLVAILGWMPVSPGML